MSVLAQETRSCLSDLSLGANRELQARFVFPPQYPGFQGHFPGDPVLPGICLIQAALAMEEARHRTAVRLAKVVAAKWFAPVRPGQELRLTSSAAADGDGAGGRVVRTRVTCGSKKVADLTLHVRGADAGGDGTA